MISVISFSSKCAKFACLADWGSLPQLHFPPLKLDRESRSMLLNGGRVGREAEKGFIMQVIVHFCTAEKSHRDYWEAEVWWRRKLSCRSVLIHYIARGLGHRGIFGGTFLFTTGKDQTVFNSGHILIPVQKDLTSWKNIEVSNYEGGYKGSRGEKTGGCKPEYTVQGLT